LTAFVLALWWGGPVIAGCDAHKVGEDVTKTDSADLAKLGEKMGKKNTPTMGGSFLIGALLTSRAAVGRLDNLHVVLAVLLHRGIRGGRVRRRLQEADDPEEQGPERRARRCSA
jgi:UDP-N-acetylmuramyl pentapeptide phosphotransferase/UDP-N-acetylglucosamine-1-phosphate transferase